MNRVMDAERAALLQKLLVLKNQEISALEGMAFEFAWTKKKPARAGRYLRWNPPATAVVRADIVEQDGVLYNASGNAGEGGPLGGGLRPVEKEPDRWWWFGPIPDPPYWTENETEDGNPTP